MQGLEGIKVLELGHMVSAAYATKLMADLGADVVKIEEPDGDRARRRGPFPDGIADPEKSGLFLALNTNKRGRTLDLRSTQDRRRLSDLIGWADLLVHNYPAAQAEALGLDYGAFQAVNPRLVMCAVTPFGLTGPYKDYAAYELTVAHAGGWAWLSPGGSDRPDLPPLRAAGQQADFQGGLAAATACLAAYSRVLQTGRGEHIDLSVQSYVASFLEHNFVFYTYLGWHTSRLGRRLQDPWKIFACKDGPIFLAVAEEDQWQRLQELMGNPDWSQQDLFRNAARRARNKEALHHHLNAWFRDWKVADLFRAGQEKRICFAPVFDMAQLAEQEQLRARNFFVEVSHPKAGRLTHLGPPYQLGQPWWKIRRPAPLLGEHNAEQLQAAAPVPPVGTATPPALPLAGVRVADFSWVWAGPFCTAHLAHLGAEVIKIESRARLDLTRRLPASPRGIKPSANTSAVFNQWAQAKKSLRLDFTTPEGRRIARELIQHSDVVVDNFATGVMDKLGFGYDALKQLKPDLIVASISGYGHTGPQKNYMAYGPAIAPLTGLSSLTGYPDGPPAEVGLSYGDPNAGINAAVAVCAALVARQRTGDGQYIDVSLWEAVAALLPEGWMAYAMNGQQPARQGNRDPWLAPHNCFRCAGEDEWVSIACGTDQEWQALCRAMDQPELLRDARFRTAADRKAHEDALEERLTAWTSQRDKWDITERLQAAGVAAFPSMNSHDLDRDPTSPNADFLSACRIPRSAARPTPAFPGCSATRQTGCGLLRRCSDSTPMRSCATSSATRTRRLPGSGKTASWSEFVLSLASNFGRAQLYDPHLRYKEEKHEGFPSADEFNRFVRILDEIPEDGEVLFEKFRT